MYRSLIQLTFNSLSMLNGQYFNSSFLSHFCSRHTSSLMSCVFIFRKKNGITFLCMFNSILVFVLRIVLLEMCVCLRVRACVSSCGVSGLFTINITQIGERFKLKFANNFVSKTILFSR